MMKSAGLKAVGIGWEAPAKWAASAAPAFPMYTVCPPASKHT